MAGGGTAALLLGATAAASSRSLAGDTEGLGSSPSMVWLGAGAQSKWTDTNKWRSGQWVAYG